MLTNNGTIAKHDMTNEVNKSYTNQKESGPTRFSNACVSPIPSSSVCSKVINNVKNDSSLPDKTFQLNSITNKNEPSPVHTKNGSRLTPSPIGSITTIQLSCLASINDERGTSTSENNNKNSSHDVKPNTVSQPSNTYYPFHSPFHMFPSY